MEELLARFQARLNHLATSILTDHQAIEAAICRDFTTPLASSLSRGCVASGMDLNEGGARFNSSGIQAVGITDVADSLFALDDVVFKKRRYPLEDVIRALDRNFEGEYNQQIRRELQGVPKFGNDGSPEARDWVNRVLKMYNDALASVDGCPRDGIYTAGYYALNVNICDLSAECLRWNYVSCPPNSRLTCPTKMTAEPPKSRLQGAGSPNHHKELRTS